LVIEIIPEMEEGAVGENSVADPRGNLTRDPKVYIIYIIRL